MRVIPEPSSCRWRKSSYSGNEAGDACVEVRDDLPRAVPVRDSKDVAGPVLMLSSAAWRPFVQGVRDGSL